MEEIQLHERRYAVKGKDRNGTDTLLYVSTEVLPETLHISLGNQHHAFINYKELKEVLQAIDEFKEVKNE